MKIYEYKINVRNRNVFVSSDNLGDEIELEENLSTDIIRNFYYKKIIDDEFIYHLNEVINDYHDNDLLLALLIKKIKLEKERRKQNE